MVYSSLYHCIRISLKQTVLGKGFFSPMYFILFSFSCVSNVRYLVSAQYIKPSSIVQSLIFLFKKKNICLIKNLGTFGQFYCHFESGFFK